MPFFGLLRNKFSLVSPFSESLSAMKPKFTAIRPSELVILAIHNLGEKSGSSEEEIIRFVTRKYALDEQVVTPQIGDALQRCLNFGIISYKNGRYGLEEVPEPPMDETDGDAAKKRGKRKRDKDGDRESNIADVIEREIREWKRKKGMSQNARTNSIVVLSADSGVPVPEPSTAGVFPATTLKTTKRAKTRTRSKSAKKAPRQPRKSAKKKPMAKQSGRSRGRPPKKAQSKPGLLARAFGLRSRTKQKAKPKAKPKAKVASGKDKSKTDSGQEACSKICPKSCPTSVEKGRKQKRKECQKIDSNFNKNNSKILDDNSDLTKSKPYGYPCEKLDF